MLTRFSLHASPSQELPFGIGVELQGRLVSNRKDLAAVETRTANAINPLHASVVSLVRSTDTKNRRHKNPKIA